jgi:oxalate decarboxylase/phosphoglucose isomerase-like protein (cupin superfamily)
MMDVLRDTTASGPAIHYYMIRGGADKKNITIWEPGLVGAEYIKSYGHYHVADFDEQYEILVGEGMVLLQMRGTDASGAPLDEIITSFRALRVKAGDIVNIPQRAGHLMVNTGTTWLVTRDNSPVNLEEVDAVSRPAHADYAPFKKMHGAAYYVIEKNGVPTLEKNSRYTQVADATIE